MEDKIFVYAGLWKGTKVKTEVKVYLKKLEITEDGKVKPEWLFEFGDVNKNKDFYCKELTIIIKPVDKNNQTLPQLLEYQPQSDSFTINISNTKSSSGGASFNASGVGGNFGVSASHAKGMGKKDVMVAAYSATAQGLVKWVYQFDSKSSLAKSSFPIHHQEAKWSGVDQSMQFKIEFTLESKNKSETGRVSFFHSFKTNEKKEEVKLPPINRLKLITLGHEASGKSSLINALFQSLGSPMRPANVYPAAKNRPGTKELKVYSFANPVEGNVHFNKPFRFIDTKGYKFDTKDTDSMNKLHKVLKGLPEKTTWDNWMEAPELPQNKPDFAIIVSDVRFVTDNEEDKSWFLSWSMSPSYDQKEERLKSLKALKNEIDSKLGQDRAVLVFTHMDMISKTEQSTMHKLIANNGISDNIVFYAGLDKSKCIQKCRDSRRCDHWTNETLEGYLRMLANFKVTTQDEV